MNTQINIVENGTTTLATAGKYCDRNIDVNVSVPSSGTENENSIVERTIAGHYENNEVVTIGAYALSHCESLESVSFQNLAYIYGYAFDGCYGLKKVDISISNSIYSKAFRRCTVLETVILRGNTVARLGNVDAFAETGIEAGVGCIYVPDDLVDSYKTATNWAVFADQIKPLSELEE